MSYLIGDPVLTDDQEFEWPLYHNDTLVSFFPNIPAAARAGENLDAVADCAAGDTDKQSAVEHCSVCGFLNFAGGLYHATCAPVRALDGIAPVDLFRELTPEELDSPAHECSCLDPSVCWCGAYPRTTPTFYGVVGLPDEALCGPDICLTCEQPTEDVICATCSEDGARCSEGHALEDDGSCETCPDPLDLIAYDQGGVVAIVNGKKTIIVPDDYETEFYSDYDAWM